MPKLYVMVCLLLHRVGYFCGENKSFFEACPVLSAFRLAAGRLAAPSRRGRLIWKIQDSTRGTPHFSGEHFVLLQQVLREKREL